MKTRKKRVFFKKMPKYRRNSGGRYQKNISKLVVFRIKLIIIIAVLVGSVVFCDVRVAPMLLKNAEERADAAISNAINDGAMDALNSEEIRNRDFVKIERDETGKTSLVNCDTALMNSFMTSVNDCVEERIANDYKSGFVKVHMGALLGISSVLNKGPELQYGYDLSTNVNCDLKSELVSAGINQTKHRIILTVTVNTTVMIPWCSANRDVICEFPVAETVIVGDVPNLLRNLDLSAKNGNDKSESQTSNTNDKEK